MELDVPSPFLNLFQVFSGTVRQLDFWPQLELMPIHKPLVNPHVIDLILVVEVKDGFCLDINRSTHLPGRNTTELNFVSSYQEWIDWPEQTSTINKAYLVVVFSIEMVAYSAQELEKHLGVFQAFQLGSCLINHLEVLSKELAMWLLLEYVGDICHQSVYHFLQLEVSSRQGHMFTFKEVFQPLIWHPRGRTMNGCLWCVDNLRYQPRELCPLSRIQMRIFRG
mmetsp:Transcript_70765/g.133679  ORF Transcript_70765/g.133679 Transcript_70765/m.133679 type:complete len:223 (+) Transcript_70765:1189-1857(+)